MGLSKIDDYRTDNVRSIRLCYLKHAVNDKKWAAELTGRVGAPGWGVELPVERDMDSSRIGVLASHPSAQNAEEWGTPICR
jgi:hypothetical protein